MFLQWALQSVTPDTHFCWGQEKGEAPPPLYCSAAQHLVQDGPTLKVLGVQWHLKIGINMCTISAISGVSMSCRKGFSWQQMRHFVPRTLPPWPSDGISGGLVSLSKASQLRSYHPSPCERMCSVGIKWTFFLFPQQNLECLRHWHGFLTADLILSSNISSKQHKSDSVLH